MALKGYLWSGEEIGLHQKHRQRHLEEGDLEVLPEMGGSRRRCQLNKIACFLATNWEGHG